MGNLNSCSFRKHSTAKLIDSRGNLRRLWLPLKAAELMLDEPGQAVCSVDELRRCGRVVAMRADDEILAGKTYVFVDLSKVHGKMSEEEIGFVEYAAAGGKRGRKKRRGSKVLPAVVVEEAREEGKGLGENGTGFSGYRSGNCKPWTPVLEPISEE